MSTLGCGPDVRVPLPLPDLDGVSGGGSRMAGQTTPAGGPSQSPRLVPPHAAGPTGVVTPPSHPAIQLTQHT